jgi:hypothetical protein
MFPNNEAARLYIEKKRWNEKVKCPLCGSDERITARGRQKNWLLRLQKLLKRVYRWNMHYL